HPALTVLFYLFVTMYGRPAMSTRVPYTTLFRSGREGGGGRVEFQRLAEHVRTAVELALPVLPGDDDDGVAVLVVLRCEKPAAKGEPRPDAEEEVARHEIAQRVLLVGADEEHALRRACRVLQRRRVTGEPLHEIDRQLSRIAAVVGADRNDASARL